MTLRHKQDRSRRKVYEALLRGRYASGVRGKVVFGVYTDNLDEGRGDLYVAAGLALELHELGYGVELIPRGRWAEIPVADVVVAMLPTFDPSTVPAGAIKVAWVRNETEKWAESTALLGYDRVLASSEHSLRRLARATPPRGRGVAHRR